MLPYVKAPIEPSAKVCGSGTPEMLVAIGFDQTIPFAKLRITPCPGCHRQPAPGIGMHRLEFHMLSVGTFGFVALM